MKKTIVTSLVFLLLSSCSQTEKPDYIDFEKAYSSFIDLATAEFGAKYGMGIAVVKDKQIIFEKYQGMADLDENKKVDKNTLFYIASVTKSITAMTALILESKGQLDFDKSLGEFFPEINFDPALKADSITIEHLMIHTSGLENDLLGDSKSLTGNHDKEKLHSLLEQRTKVNSNAPFGKFEYTNLGYNILGMIMERELGTDWKSLAKQEVFTPLEMNHSSTNISTAKAQGWEIAKPHTQKNDSNKLVRLYLEKKDNTMHEAGGIISTVEDMARWMIVQLNDGAIDGEQIIQESLIRKSQLPLANQEKDWYDLKRYAYGYGWNHATTPLGDTISHHFGGFNGMHSEFSFNLKDDVGVMILANEGGISYNLSILLNSYVFDYFSKRENLDAYYQEKLKSYSETYSKAVQADNEYMAEISQRPWRLELPLSAYVGIYSNELVGNLMVEVTEENKLKATLGNLSSSLVTGHRTNAIRVQMEEQGGGSVIQFELNKDQVDKANWGGQTFSKQAN